MPEQNLEDIERPSRLRGLDSLNRFEVDYAAIGANFDEIRRRVGPDTRIVAVVKADAYGHGAVQVARSLAGRSVDFFAAGSLEEAIAVKRAVPSPVIVFSSLPPPFCPRLAEDGLIASVDNKESAEALSQLGGRRPLEVWVKVDGGFGRFGVALPEAADFIRSVSAMPGLKLGGVYTHLPYSDEAGRAWAEKQGHAFSDMVSAIAREGIRIPVTQMLSSPGILCGAASRHNAIAPGSLLYGLSRFGRGGEPSMQGFRPALRSVTTTLLHVGRRLAGAEAAPYLRNGHSTLGVVPIGIHHGYRPTSPRAHMIVGGSEAPVLRVCLESTILDLSGAPNSAIGTEATVLGRSADREITLDRLAEWQQTSPLLLLTALGKSIPRFPT